MKFSLSSILLLLNFFCLSQTKGTIPSGFTERIDSDHFVFLWNNEETTLEEVEDAKGYSDEIFLKFQALVGESKMPNKKIIVTFNGQGYDPAIKKKYLSNVDYQGRVHLYRYSNSGYTGGLFHECLHAFRRNTLPNWVSFFEEGFASAISYYLEPETENHSRQGYPMEVVAGYWFDTGNDIPMRILREEHENLLHCRIQTYVLREDFFTYLINKYGITKYLEFAYSPKIGSIDLYKGTWGKMFDELVSEWESDLIRRYNNYPNAKELAEEYLTIVPAKFIRVCEAGVDY